jgi:hypothetical protein
VRLAFIVRKLEAFDVKRKVSFCANFVTNPRYFPFYAVILGISAFRKRACCEPPL